jgi:hypothetical protein
MGSCKNSKSGIEMNDKIPSQTEVQSVGFSPYETGVSLICVLISVK